MSNIGKPMIGKVLVKPFEVKEEIVSGIIFTPHESYRRGEVVAVGDSFDCDEPELFETDQILFGLDIGQPIQIDEVDYLLMNQHDIWIVMDRVIK